MTNVNLKMKMDKKYWLRGGIIFTLIAFLYMAFPIILLILGIRVGNFFKVIFYPQTFFVNFYCNNFIFPYITGDFKGCNILMPQILITVLIIMIGLLLGWLYGKIKNKSKQF